MNSKLFPDKGFTHGGIFHADDVFTTALLKILNPDFRWERGFVVPEDFDGIVYDIGCGEFDHHQADARVRENGVPFASFGLVWEKYGGYVLDEKEAEAFDKDFVQMLDLTDNTGSRNSLSSLIHDMNPEWNEEVSSDEAFDKAVEFAIFTLETQFKHIQSRKEADSIIQEKLSEAVGQTLYIGEYVPWGTALKDTDIQYVIYKSERGGYNIQIVPHKDEDETTKSFPVEWRGKTREELEKITGIKGLTFCHNAGFLCATETLEAAWAVTMK